LLPIIRQSLLLNNSFSDQEILSSFTLPLPGHMQDDADFNINDFRKIIELKLPEIKLAQTQILNKIMFSHPSFLVKNLSDPKITFIGHGLGAAIAYYFTCYEYKQVRSNLFISFGEKFKTFSLLKKRFYLDFIKQKKNEKITSMIEQTSKIWKKIELANIVENPKQKGLKSAILCMQKFSAQKLFNKLPLNEQTAICNIPTTLIYGENDEYVSAKSVLNLASIYNKKTNLQKLNKQKDTVLSQNQEKMQNQDQTFLVKMYPEAFHYITETHAEYLAEDIQLFLKRNLDYK